MKQLEIIMKQNIIHIRMKPQLVRKKTVVKTNTSTKMIVKSSNKTNNQINNKVPRNTKPQREHISPPPKADSRQIKNRGIPPQSAVSNNNRIKRLAKKSTSVKYVSKDISEDSLLKIHKLKNVGIGKVLILLGNGPTLNEVDLEKLKGLSKVDIFAVNKPDPRIWPPTYWAFFDLSQFRRNEQLWNDYNGILINSTAIKRIKPNGLQIKNLGGRGFSRDISKGLHIGRSSIYASMQIAYWMNYDKIYIFGCDMNPDGINGKLHFYGINPDVDVNARKERFKKEAEYYDQAADILNAEERSKYVFCSSENKWGFVNKYAHLDHKIAISRIIEQLGD